MFLIFLADVQLETLMNESARLNKLNMDSDYARNIAITRSGRVSKPPLRRHLGEYIRYDAYGRAIEVKFRRSTDDLEVNGGSSAGAVFLNEFLK